MHWTVIPNPSIRPTDRMGWLARLRWRLLYWETPPVARVAITDDRARTIVTHPDNVTAICDFLVSRGHPYRVGSPTLRTVRGGK